MKRIFYILFLPLILWAQTKTIIDGVMYIQPSVQQSRWSADDFQAVLKLITSKDGRFDLSTLPASARIDVRTIRYIRIADGIMMPAGWMPITELWDAHYDTLANDSLVYVPASTVQDSANYKDKYITFAWTESGIDKEVLISILIAALKSQFGFNDSTRQVLDFKDSNLKINKITVYQQTTKWDSLLVDQEVSYIDDDARIGLKDSTCGWGEAMIGNNEGFARFRFSKNGAVTLLSDCTANVAIGNVDGKFCILDNAYKVAIKNRLGAAKKIALQVHYYYP